jgi:hypothetical protein
MARLVASVVVVLAAAGLTPARADVITYQTLMNGPNEPTPSLGTGNVLATYDNVAHTLRLQGSFTGLGSATTRAHIHAPTALPLTGTSGIATVDPAFAGFPLGVQAGSFDSTLDLLSNSTYAPAFVTANGGSPATAEVALTNFFAQGRAYFNIHTVGFGSGEIRGFLTPVPEPGTMALTGLAALVALNRCRKLRRCQPMTAGKA